MLSNELRAMSRSWVKVFLAASLALYLSGVRDPWMLLDAGLAAMLPLVITWLDPHDMRFGRIRLDDQS